ncbi:hypothetical protein ACRAWG_09915 [Methylobacterium sp. P31]
MSRGKHADDPDKNRLRNEEVEYFRAAVAGMPTYAFGRLFREQLAKDPRRDQTRRTPTASTDPRGCGPHARASAPDPTHLFIGCAVEAGADPKRAPVRSASGQLMNGTND